MIGFVKYLVWLILWQKEGVAIELSYYIILRS